MNTRLPALLACELDSIDNAHDRAERAAELMELMCESFPKRYEGIYRELLMQGVRELRAEVQEQRESEALEKACRVYDAWAYGVEA